MTESKQTWNWKTGSPDKRERLQAYAEWLLTPVEERVPSTKAELAELLGVSTQTLRNYSKDPWLQREVVEQGRGLNKVERVQDILDSLYRQATDPEKPSVTAARTFLDWVGRQTELQAAVDYESLTDTDIAAVALDILRRMAE